MSIVKQKAWLPLEMNPHRP